MKFRYLFLKSKLTWGDWGQADSFFSKVFYCKVTAVYIQYTVKVFALNTDVCFTEKKMDICVNICLWATLFFFLLFYSAVRYQNI